MLYHETILLWIENLVCKKCSFIVLLYFVLLSLDEKIYISCFILIVILFSDFRNKHKIFHLYCKDANIVPLRWSPPLSHENFR